MKDQVKQQIAMVAPRHLTPDRIARIAMTSIMRTPKLADCTQQSLLGCVLTCSQLGLEPDSVSGMAYLIPYKDVCTLIVGYKGLMELARRSGEIVSLEARVVFDCDEFDYAYGTDSGITHRPGEADKKTMTHVYAVAKFRSGGFQFDVMTKADVDAVRGRSRAKSDGPWVTDYNEMARKTVMRRLCKYLPSSPELSRAVSLDESAERGIPQDIEMIDVDATVATDAKPTTLDEIAEPQEAATA